MSSFFWEWTGVPLPAWPSALYGCAQSCAAIPSNGEGGSGPWWNPNDESFSTIIEDYHDQCGSSDEEEEQDEDEEAGIPEGDCVLGEDWTIENILRDAFDEGLVVDHNGVE